ncbi:MAG TPA: di-heme-cytochrome C peroxidase [Terracidiphilus sp.]|nr:di-heme-cytochrome C peroxidase [Terracidiphilus sp.]
MVNFERKLPTEEVEAADIVRGILKVQAAFAKAQNRPLGRGTHTKGICARATFEVFDLERKIGDHTLVTRLAQGIYAKPGVYPATIRFANAASTVYPDRQPDLRAMSFSVELPGGAPGSPQFQDFSLQTAPTFPINDAHTFAVLMKVLSAGSGGAKLKAILSLSFLDFCRFAKASVLGILQQHGKSGPYQTLRYWSTVPFRNGPFEAVKYSAIPNPHNPAHTLQEEPDALRDELIRHLEQDEKMSSFDIALQVLDAERMRHWGMRRQASFWVENATVDWKETQAPFHVVGRLTLVAKSDIPMEACEPKYIDVTDHATPDSEPLGSINRARRVSEVASRKVRLGEATVESVLDSLPSAPARPRSILRSLPRLTALAVVGILLLYFTSGFLYRILSARNIPAYEHVDQVRYLNQGWGLDRDSPDRELFYYTPQGAGMHGFRYSWFVNLEQPFSKKRFTGPHHMRALDFVVDPDPTPTNPDLLPVGFAKRYDSTLHDNVVDITCAACHTGQLNVTRNGTTTAIRIDGGEGMSAFTDTDLGSFQLGLGLSFAETLANPFKFNRFAARVLGPDADTFSAKLTLWRNMSGVALNLGKVFLGSSAPWHYPVQEGYGRTDALTRIGNVVFGDHISPRNYHLGNAPVSYPYLWNIWKFDWVQYNASVSQPMARNVSESMGVGADFKLVDDYGRPIPPSQRYTTSVNFLNLARIESTLQRLQPPQWPEDLLGPINQASAARGKVLYDSDCAKCHEPHVTSTALKQYFSPGRLPTDPMWDIRPVAVQEIGTDPTAANNFVNDRVDLTRTGITYDEVKPLLLKEYNIQKQRYQALIPALQQEIAQQQKAGASADVIKEYTHELQDAQSNPVTDETIAQHLNSLNMRAVNAGEALNILGLIIRDRYYTQNRFSPQAQACFAGFDTLDIPDVFDGYKPRPLAGVWATPPFLHNGSVPTLFDMLSPVSERPKRFSVGNRDFDPVKVGFAIKPRKGTRDGFWMDTTLPGNQNTGHQFAAGYVPYDPSNPSAKRPKGIIGPALSVQQRMDIIEYLKILRNDPAPADRAPIDCFALLK